MACETGHRCVPWSEGLHTFIQKQGRLCSQVEENTGLRLPNSQAELREAVWVQKAMYENKVRHSTLEIGDRVLIKNVTPKGKFDDKWQREPYLVMDIPFQNLQVYRVNKEKG
ncbi:hypothetical protein DPMN_186139 [Dreissena polymorpha]|uniref:Uncharacterized protein n=1 Tax=Dreissena polymorpha TaxID=45954 RepID=A0A9D4I9C1_DREPO|nr:hypothetical protein DPMN_186139 [Dreissena polymorpha]